MIKLRSLLSEEKVKGISLQFAIDNKFFGPVYHGTSSNRRELIDNDGFKVFKGNGG